MKLFTEVSIPEASVQLEPGASVISIGSCFAETIAEYLNSNRFPTLYNPFGTLYNPVSISEVLIRAITNQPYTADDLLVEHGRAIPLSHATRFSGTDRDTVIDLLNQTDELVRLTLTKASLLIVTLGTAQCWRFLDTNKIVGNCHRIPNNRFQRELLSPSQVVDSLATLIETVHNHYPQLTVLFTVSPVRHIRDSLIENSRSKASLIYAMSELSARFPKLIYFPAYEIMIDELRDYRFYDESLVEPSNTAREIIRQRFSQAVLSPRSRQFIQHYQPIYKSMNHRIDENADTARFAETALKKIEELSKQFPHIDFTAEQNYFTALK